MVRPRAGYTAIESPEWTPARSMCSMTPGMRVCSPSQTASTSASLPSRYLSMRIGFAPPVGGGAGHRVADELSGAEGVLDVGDGGARRLGDAQPLHQILKP